MLSNLTGSNGCSSTFTGPFETAGGAIGPPMAFSAAAIEGLFSSGPTVASVIFAGRRLLWAIERRALSSSSLVFMSISLVNLTDRWGNGSSTCPNDRFPTHHDFVHAF